MSDAEVDQEQLIKELIAESFALRTKSEHLSQYVETRIADLVKTRSELSTIKGESEREIGRLKSESEREIRRLRAGIETANQQRNELQDKLDSLISEHEALGEANLQMTSQRDRLRDRMAQVDSSPEYRLAKRLRRILGVVLKDVPTQ
jgi:chromosome segregation ATPase